MKKLNYNSYLILLVGALLFAQNWIMWNGIKDLIKLVLANG